MKEVSNSQKNQVWLHFFNGKATFKANIFAIKAAIITITMSVTNSHSLIGAVHFMRKFLKEEILMIQPLSRAFQFPTPPSGFRWPKTILSSFSLLRSSDLNQP